MNPARPTARETAAESHATFFRQGGWLILANGLGGAFMLATQVVAGRWMEDAEYVTFFALLRVYLLLGIPSVGLQTVFAHQAAAAVTADAQARLAATVHAVLRGTLWLWLGVVVVTALAQGWIMRAMSLTHPAALWATVGMGLGCLWAPVLRGVLQGRQHFAGLGAAMILDGVGRFTAVLMVVLAGGQAAGGMVGALLGLAAATLWCAWLVRDLARGATGGFAWGEWLGRVVPLTLGAGTVLVFTTLDVVYVQGLFPQAARELYMPAAMIGLGLTMYALPLSQVMFPKVARSVALTRPSRAMPLALATTAAGGAVGAVACTLFPELPLRILYFAKPAFWAAAPLVPWFAWAVLPLTLANVLINNLLARERFAVVPWVVGVGLLYVASLALARPWLTAMEPLPAFKVLLALLGGGNLLLLAVAVLFTAREPDPAAAAAPSA